MSVFQTALSSARFNRALLWFSAAVLAVGVAVLISSLVGGSDARREGNQPGFKPALAPKSEPLKNAAGAQVTRFNQLDPQIKQTVRTFIATAVARKNLDKSWDVIAPSLKAGYTRQKWAHAKALPVIPYPVADVNHLNYYLEEASTNEILALVGVYAPKKANTKPVTFRIGLHPVGPNKVWMVDYWMPRWTPPVPTNE